MSYFSQWLMGPPSSCSAGRIRRRGAPTPFDFTISLGTTISSIPSQYLSAIDLTLLRTIQPPRTQDYSSLYYVSTIISGLIFVRIVEVSHPSLTGRAHAFRDGALRFIEPRYSTALQITRAQQPASDLATDLNLPKCENIRADIKNVLSSLEILPDIRLGNSEDDRDFSIQSAVSLARAVMARAKATPREFSDKDAHIAGLFAFGASGYLNSVLKTNFEFVSASAAIWVVDCNSFDGGARGDFVQEIISAYSDAAP